MNQDAPHCLLVVVSGYVQGVCFRHYTRQRAIALGITGWVKNRPDGNVEALICGPSDQLDAMLAWLAHGPEHARVTDCHASPCDSPQLPTNFAIST